MVTIYINILNYSLQGIGEVLTIIIANYFIIKIDIIVDFLLNIFNY